MTSQSPEPRTRREREERSLDVTQRAIISVLVGIVFGTFSASTLPPVRAVPPRIAEAIT